MLLISVDGLHDADLTACVKANPSSAMATLAGKGAHSAQASSAMPSDSFPGLLAFVTAGSPKSTGVHDEDSYDRLLSAAALEAATAALHIAQVLDAARIGAMFGDAMADSRVPDLMILPQEGVIYTKPTATKVAEHGGFSEGDTHVPGAGGGAGDCRGGGDGRGGDDVDCADDSGGAGDGPDGLAGGQGGRDCGSAGAGVEVRF